MEYQISRNGTMYGPYTLEDLKRYVASGNVLFTDMAKSEEMSEWVPVSELLDGQASTSAGGDSGRDSGAAATSGFTPSAYSTPGSGMPGSGASGYPNASYNPQAANAALAASPYPDAPNLHWGLVLLFGVLSCYIFIPIWNLVVSAWLKRVQPNSTALFYYIGAYGLLIFNYALGFALGLHTIMTPGVSHFGPALGIRSALGVVVWVLRLIARFMERASLEEHFNGPEPMGLRLNPVLTFFFGALYFQYKLNEVNSRKQAARFGTGQAF